MPRYALHTLELPRVSLRGVDTGRLVVFLCVALICSLVWRARSSTRPCKRASLWHAQPPCHLIRTSRATCLREEQLTPSPRSPRSPRRSKPPLSSTPFSHVKRSQVERVLSCPSNIICVPFLAPEEAEPELQRRSRSGWLA